MDIIIVSSNKDDIGVFRNTSTSGSISFSPLVAFDVGDNPFHMNVADIDGDGMLDVATVNYNDDNISILVNTAQPGIINANTFAPEINFLTGPGPGGIAFGDLNRDMKTEMLCTSWSDQNISIFENECIPGPNAGGDAAISICSDDPPVILGDVLLGIPDTGGTWVDNDATGAVIGGTFNTSLVSPGTYTFTYAVADTSRNLYRFVHCRDHYYSNTTY